MVLDVERRTTNQQNYKPANQLHKQRARSTDFHGALTTPRIPVLNVNEILLPCCNKVKYCA